MAAEVKFQVEAAVAAAIVTLSNLPDSVREKVIAEQKFVVHPHVAEVSGSDSLLNSYLRTIYAGRSSVGAEYPPGAFQRLTKASSLKAATQDLATMLATHMSKRRANPGILFGFLLCIGGDTKAHGVIKADLDDEQRFHFQSTGDDTWSIDAVRELLPPPRAEYAKFAIAPQPVGDAGIGVHDVSNSSSAADYFLGALKLTVPRERGTQALVAQAALDAGYAPDLVRSTFSKLDSDRDVDELIGEAFPNIAHKKRETLKGSPNRPMQKVRANDAYISLYKTRNPRFRLEVDDSVQVEVNGRVFTVTLPEDSDPVEYKVRM